MTQAGPQRHGAEYTFDFLGGRLCLDFVNTVSGSRAGPTERLTAYRDLLLWARQAGALGDREARRLSRAAGRAPVEAARGLEGAVRFREALFRLFAAVASRRSPPRDDLRC